MQNNRLNKPVFIDPAISRKSKLVNDALKIKSVPLPSVVEISESGTCNRSCSFCPRSDPEYPNEKKFISKELLEKLAHELKSEDYSGIILFSGFVEPLIDKNIYDHIRVLRKNLPKAQIDLVTNGDPLSLVRLNHLFKSGLSTILISVYDGPKEAEKFKRLCEEAKLTETQFVIRHRYLPQDQDFGITLSNRAGMMGNAEYSIPATKEPLVKPCFYPYYTFFVDYLGDVLLCPHDWGKKRIAGNLLNQSFNEIWMGPIYMNARERLGKGDRRFSPCSVCDVDGTLMGHAHRRAWAEVFP